MEDVRLILLGVGMFTTIVLVLVAIILAARSRLVAAGQARILINDDPATAFCFP